MELVQSADGTRIAFDRSGAGPALVLVVGAFCDRSSTKALASVLGSTFTVYEYDRRGRGDSGDVAPYSIEREVEDLAAVVEATGGSAFAFGHSSGGALVLEAAASGVPIRRLVVYEPPYTDGPSYDFAAQLAQMNSAGRASEVVEAFLGLSGTPAGAIDQMKAAPYWQHMTSFAPTLVYDVRLCNDGIVPLERFANVSAPTLALAGGESPAWTHEGARAIAAAVQHGESRVLDGQNHGVADDILCPLLIDFLL